MTSQKKQTRMVLNEAVVSHVSSVVIVVVVVDVVGLVVVAFEVEAHSNAREEDSVAKPVVSF